MCEFHTNAVKKIKDRKAKNIIFYVEGFCKLNCSFCHYFILILPSKTVSFISSALLSMEKNIPKT